MVITEPNVADLHDRMPVIFESKDIESGAIQPKPLRS
jgi:putative SOS response-associated peptidase YedK